MNRKAVYVSLSVSLFGLALLVMYVRRVHEEATGGSPVELLAVRRDAEPGDLVTEELLMTRTLPSSYLEDRHLLASDMERVLGVRIANPLRATQTLLSTDLAIDAHDHRTLASRVPQGMRAIAVAQSDQNPFAGLLTPGDRVDVLLTRSAPSATNRVVTLPLLQNLLVLSVGGSVGSEHDERAIRRRGDVSLLVTIEQATLLTHAQHAGQLRLILRNRGDLEVAGSLPEVDDLDIFDLPTQIRHPHRRTPLERVD